MSIDLNKNLLPGWEERLKQVDSSTGGAATPATPMVPRSAAHYASRIHFVKDVAGGQEMVEFVRQRPIAYAGLDTEFQNSRPGVVMKAMNGSLLGWSDPKSVIPLLISFAFVEAGEDGNDQLYRFVVDVRNAAVLPHLQVVLDMQVPFCCHSASADLQCLWQLGLREPRRVLWDASVAQRVQLLGRFHARNNSRSNGLGRPVGDAELEIASRCELVAICRQHGIEYPFASSNEDLHVSAPSVGQPFDQ